MISKYTNDTKIIFHDFTRQYEGEDVVIQSSLTGIPLVLPIDAIEILDDFSSGKTLDEVRKNYEQKYGEVPDLEDLLDILEKQGFINSPSSDNKIQKDAVKYHFVNFPQVWAKKIFSGKSLIIYFVIVTFAIIILFIDPSIFPGWRASFFTQNLTLMKLVLIFFDFATLFGHEMAHLIAAKAVGVSSRLGISNRLWHLVAETDMTGVWGIPRKLRFLPLLAGSLLDMVSASFLVLILFAEHHKWLMFSGTITQLFSAMLLTYLMRLLWQCYFFIRTDFYYVFTTRFQCKNLMVDTEVFLLNKLHFFIPAIKKMSQSSIPLGERKIIRFFALFWILGRIVAFASLFYIEIPLLWNYCAEIISIVSQGYQTNSYAFFDALLMAILIIVPQLVGFFLWFRSFYLSYSR
jgi:putative peptide zinc metalloprotease protein